MTCQPQETVHAVRYVVKQHTVPNPQARPRSQCGPEDPRPEWEHGVRSPPSGGCAYLVHLRGPSSRLGTAAACPGQLSAVCRGRFPPPGTCLHLRCWLVLQSPVPGAPARPPRRGSVAAGLPVSRETRDAAFTTGPLPPGVEAFAFLDEFWE